MISVSLTAVSMSLSYLETQVKTCRTGICGLRSWGKERSGFLKNAATNFCSVKEDASVWKNMDVNNSESISEHKKVLGLP